MRKEYRVIATWSDGGDNVQTVGRYRTIEQAHRKQQEVVNQIPLSALEEHITISIVRIKHR